jgi:ABC-type transport system involved in cytochrome c biogenesis permease subunit
VSTLASALYVALVPVCAAAALVGFAAWARPDSRPWSRAAEVAGVAALALGLAAWIGRWAVAGHLPLFGTYESALSLAVAVLLAALIWRRGAASAGLRPWPVAAAVAAGLLAHGLRFDASAFPLTISERSWVVDLHALLAWAAFGTLAVNAGLALARMAARSTPPVDQALVTSLGVGFGLHTAMIASGSFYEFLLFGRAWSFDPVETLAFAAWVAYGALLHMHRFAGWQGRRLAHWCVGVFAVLVVSYRLIVYFPPWSTYHIFDMDLRVHVTGSPTAPL